MMQKGSITPAFINAQLEVMRQKDLNPYSDSALEGEALVEKLGRMKADIKSKSLKALILKWYAQRYHIKSLHCVHQDDLVFIFGAFLGTSPNGTLKEFQVEEAIFEVTKAAKVVRRNIRST